MLNYLFGLTGLFCSKNRVFFNSCCSGDDPPIVVIGDGIMGNTIPHQHQLRRRNNSRVVQISEDHPICGGSWGKSRAAFYDRPETMEAAGCANA
jgi:hypothetical protein